MTAQGALSTDLLLPMHYKVVNETVGEALALIKQKGFEEETVDGKTSYVTHLEKYVLELKDTRQKQDNYRCLAFIITHTTLIQRMESFLRRANLFLAR